MVFEILGVNFLEIIKRYDYKGVPLPFVVICLREDEVNEIAKTGQLTTTKMSEHQDIIRKINMKVAGTLTTTTNVAEPEPLAKEPTATETNSQIPDGLTAK